MSEFIEADWPGLYNSCGTNISYPNHSLEGHAEDPNYRGQQAEDERAGGGECPHPRAQQLHRQGGRGGARVRERAAGVARPRGPRLGPAVLHAGRQLGRGDGQHARPAVREAGLGHRARHRADPRPARPPLARLLGQEGPQGEHNQAPSM